MKKPKIAVRPYRHSKTHKFSVDLRPFGKGRKFFKTRAEAEAEVMRQKTLLERHSREAVGLSQREMSDFITAKTKLGEYGEKRGQGELKMVGMTQAQFPSKATADNEASRARVRRGRKPVVTPERVNMICELLARGESEHSACIRAGIGSTAWGAAKRNSPDLRERIATARDQWAQLRHARHAAALHQSQAMRAANRKALKPRPIRQAQLVAWHLTFRVPLYYTAIPDAEIIQACERFNLPLETWRRQESAFGLLKKVYARRAQLRGQQPLNAAPVTGRQQLQGTEIIEQPENTTQQEPLVATQPSALYRWWAEAKPASDEDAEQPSTKRDGIPRLL
jgi:hypothetical protein